MALSRYCLDTSAYSWFRRGDPSVVELIDSARWIGMPSIVLGELHLGFQRGSRRERNEDELADFLAHPLVEELRVDHDVAYVYAEIVRSLRAKGTPIPTNDAWIAATASRAGAPIVAYDPHFALVDRVGAIVLEPDANG